MDELERISGKGWAKKWWAIRDSMIEKTGRDALLKCAAFHGMLGGTESPEDPAIPYADLPGDNSVIKYLEKILKNLKEMSP